VRVMDGVKEAQSTDEQGVSDWDRFKASGEKCFFCFLGWSKCSADAHVHPQNLGWVECDAVSALDVTEKNNGT
jgi:hypothetical protein